MTMTLTQIEHEVDTLSQDDQFRLFEHLEHRLVPEQKELDNIWAEEAEKRYQAYRQGKTTAIPADKVFTEALGRYKQ